MDHLATTWREPGGDRLAHVAWEARQEKGYSLLSVALCRTLAFQRGPCIPGPEGWDWGDYDRLSSEALT